MADGVYCWFWRIGDCAKVDIRLCGFDFPEKIVCDLRIRILSVQFFVIPLELVDVSPQRRLSCLCVVIVDVLSELGIEIV